MGLFPEWAMVCYAMKSDTKILRKISTDANNLKPDGSWYKCIVETIQDDKIASFDKRQTVHCKIKKFYPIKFMIKKPYNFNRK